MDLEQWQLLLLLQYALPTLPCPHQLLVDGDLVQWQLLLLVLQYALPTLPCPHQLLVHMLLLAAMGPIALHVCYVSIILTVYVLPSPTAKGQRKENIFERWSSLTHNPIAAEIFFSNVSDHQGHSQNNYHNFSEQSGLYAPPHFSTDITKKYFFLRLLCCF